MKITCQSCQAKYTIADEKVLGKIVKIRCKKCGATIVVNGNDPVGLRGPPRRRAAPCLRLRRPAGRRRALDRQRRRRRSADDDHAEIVAAYQAGVVTDETFCWKDGMSDWLPLREIERPSRRLHGHARRGAASEAGLRGSRSRRRPCSATSRPRHRLGRGSAYAARCTGATRPLHRRQATAARRMTAAARGASRGRPRAGGGPLLRSRAGRRRERRDDERADRARRRRTRTREAHRRSATRTASSSRSTR